jgi:hypothetical protein
MVAPLPTPTPPPPAPPMTEGGLGTYRGFRVNGLRLAAFRMGAPLLGSIRRGGISSEGLRANAEFVAWFEGADGGDIAFHDEVMRYLAACALAAGDGAGYTDGKGARHAFPGDLGLARAWARPGASTDAEVQLVSACLMAHANTALPEPRHVQIALRGPAPLPDVPPAVSAVLQIFDGVFFGDLFGSPQRLYICSPSTAPPPNYVSTLLSDWGRQCYFSKDGCGGVFTVVDCARACTTGAGYPWGPGCTVDGRTFQAVGAYVPDFRRASGLRLDGTAALQSCGRCLDLKAVGGLDRAGASARASWRLATGGSYVLEVHYASGAPAQLRVEVDGQVVRGDGGDVWRFPATGGNDVWGHLPIPVTLATSSTVTLRGAGAPAPLLDALWLRMP